jgi:hypothetical protein
MSNIYVKNLSQNIIPLGLFIYGAMGLGPFAGIILKTMVVFYWVISILSFILPNISVQKLVEKRHSMKELQGTLGLITKSLSNNYVYFNIVEDIIIAGILSYFGYDILAAVYILHIFGYVILFFNIKDYFITKVGAERWDNVTKNLQKAFERGETTFTILELLEDPRKDLLKKIR